MKPVQTGLRISLYGSYFEYIKHKIFKSCHSLKSTPRDKTKMNIFRAREIELTYPDIWRIFISGSSSAGKTYFAKQLLSTGLMKVERIYYFHPDIQEDFPVDWCEYFKDIPIVCESGLPTIEELNEMPPYSVVVLDDQFTECAESKQMSYLFRVLSSKKKLHLMIMTQRYYDMGSKGLNIRNCSNYHVLMSNTDIRTNHRVGFQMGLDKEIKLAEKLNKQKLYPYIVIDRTNQARVNGVQVYTDILSKHKEVILNSMLGVWISKTNFCNKFEIVDQNTARYVDKKSQEKPRAHNTESETEERDTSQRTELARRTGGDTSQRTYTARTTEGDTSRRTRVFKRYLEKRRVARAVEQTLQKRRRRTKL